MLRFLRKAGEFAGLLGRKRPESPNGESFMDTTTRLLTLLVTGTEETHASLRSLHGLMTAPGFTAAMRAAIHET